MHNAQATTVLSLTQVSLNRSELELFSGLDLQLQPGELTLIQGDTGCGKSSLLQLMAGLITPDAGRVSAAGRVALILQDPDLQLIRDQVGPEVALVMEQLGLEAAVMPEKVTAALDQVGLHLSQAQQVRELSLGQRYRLLIAAQLVVRPKVLLLDEPWAQLDDDGFRQLRRLLQDLLADGIAVVVTEHRTDVWQDLADRQLSFVYQDTASSGVVSKRLVCHQQDHGKGVSAYSDLFPVNSISCDFSWPSGSAECSSAEPLLVCDAFELALNTERSLYGPSLALNPGTLVQLTGCNGSGKSSFVDLLLGIRSLKTGRITCLGHPPEAHCRKQSRKGELGFVLQHPARQIFADTVEQELAFSLLRAGVPVAETERRVAQMLADLQLEKLALRSPYTLSYGQQHLVAIASQAILMPRLLILDDPCAGLDARSLTALQKLLARLLTTGCGILVTGHRVFAGGNAHWQIQGDCLVDLSADVRPIENQSSDSEALSYEKQAASDQPDNRAADEECEDKYIAIKGFSAVLTETHWVTLKLLLTPLLVAACFMLPVVGLVVLAGVLSLLVVCQPKGAEHWLRLFKLMSLQFVLLYLFYLLRFGWQSWPDALLVSARLFLAFLPGLWFFLSTEAHQLVVALRPVMPARSALVLSATLALIPRLSREAQQLYQLQILRGALIRPKHFWQPGGWRDLMNTVLQPLLIQLIRLTRQQALALKSRGYRGNPQPTCYPAFSQQKRTCSNPNPTERTPEKNIETTSEIS